MKSLIIASLILCLPFLALAQKSRKAFAYDYNIDDLPNGLHGVGIKLLMEMGMQHSYSFTPPPQQRK